LAGLFRGKAVWESVRLTDGGKLLYNQIQWYPYKSPTAKSRHVLSTWFPFHISL